MAEQFVDVSISDMSNCLRHIVLLLGLITAINFLNSEPAQAERVKDIASIGGVRTNQLVGYGIVVGLAGSGDGGAGITLQSMQTMVARFGIVTEVEDLNASNAAAVMVTTDLKPFMKPGQTIDITVSTLVGAQSLKGGTLLMTPLLGADGETYAIAQGNLVVGGLGASGEDGSSLTVNVPTVGRIPKGATVERVVPSTFLTSKNIMVNLHQGDFSTANSLADAVNDIFGKDVALAIDANSIRVTAPVDPSQRVSFVSLLESIEVKTAEPPARVIVNSRTGTIVISGQVMVKPAAVSQGSLAIRIDENVGSIPGAALVSNGDQVVSLPTGQVAEIQESEIEIIEEAAQSFIIDEGVNLSTLVDSINQVGATTSDLVAILEALREAGALSAELIII
ncbi:flagellar basal body P-ring protein FlgI [Planktomarina temperata]|nr:flagellar basal body P-ring protein FlgI [Planktomarina temperata]MDC1262690.1 flagellar basal body P-ring protein FlgI [Planktomarina temperata]